MDILNTVYGGNSLQEWVIALALAIASAVALRLVIALLSSRLRRLTEKTTNQLDDVIVESLSRTRAPTLLMVGVALGSTTLTLSSQVTTAIRAALITVLLVQSGLWASHALKEWLERYRKRQLEEDRGAATTVGAIGLVLQISIWTMALLIILSNLGVNITALITGLGIGGIAVALALQSVFSDLFASLSIVLDKPFVIGDFLVIGDHLGVVENVGLKTTRLCSLSGEQLVFSNSDILKSRIHNYGRMYERRVVFQIGVTYQTSQESLEAIPRIIREAIESQKKTRFDRSHFAKFGDFALTFESVYYVLAPDYNLYMDIQEQINLRIRKRFLAEGIEFAYPTQTLMLQRVDPSQMENRNVSGP